jgi:PKD repeat protein
MVANFGSDNVSVYDIAPSGGLRPVAGSPFPTGGDGPAIRSTVMLPNQGPVASFTARLRPAGAPTRFDASTSVDPDGRIASYRWDFGDGVVRTAGPAPRHAYRRAGRFTVTLTVTDNEGCTARRIFTGQVVLCNGTPGATFTRTVTIGR